MQESIETLHAELEERVRFETVLTAPLKSKAESVLRPEDIGGMRPALGRFDDSWPLAFGIECMAGGKVVIFLPGAPDPWSGSVCVLTEDRITPLDLTVKSAADIMKRLGKGSAGALRDPPNSNKSSA